ncbi:MAG TPA: type II toxin-antitoxin system Phd/YefM family antitoxin [Thermomicrobiales bacterium]|nr:type II toxin-antitoxin system Phd/YefM family antitoxin [Thermomicrobiales bacterium]
MVKTMSARDARANFGDLLGSVYYTKEPVIVEKKGKPVAVVISPEEFEQFRQQKVERAWATIECLQERNADKDPEEVLRDVTAEVEAVRQEMYDEERAH